MSNYEFPADIDSLVKKQLSSGEYGSQDEVLLAALQSLESENENWNAVKDALDSLEAGEKGLTLDDAFNEIRRRNKIASSA